MVLYPQNSGSHTNATAFKEETNMIARFKNWYYGEDGMNPIYRTWKFHKLFAALLVGSFLLVFRGMEVDDVSTKLLAACGLFAFFFCIGVLPQLAYGEHYKLAIQMNGGGTAVFMLVLCLVLGVIIGGVVTPLYLLLLASDLRYRAKVRRRDPELVRKPRPGHKNLAK